MSVANMFSDQTFRFIAYTAACLALAVVVMGAYVRLSHAGLGCPDWPGCYGRLIMPIDVDEAEGMTHDFVERPVEYGKAWKEMIHRYAAGTLGLLILALSVLAWKRRNMKYQPVLLPFVLLLLVIFQALLGMWTVTLLLKPIIVMAHLLGGMTLLALLFWLVLSVNPKLYDLSSDDNRIFPWSVIAICIIAIQIGLGGWTSANYAAVACPDFPTCQNQWWPAMDFMEGFVLWHGLGIDYEGGILAGEARTAIHMSHRMGALVTLMVVGTVAIRAFISENKTVSNTGILLGILLLIQIGLGITNIVKVLPLPIAVAHNGVAALLLLCAVALLRFSLPKRIEK